MPISGTTAASQMVYGDYSNAMSGTRRANAGASRSSAPAFGIFWQTNAGSVGLLMSSSDLTPQRSGKSVVHAVDCYGRTAEDRRDYEVSKRIRPSTADLARIARRNGPSPAWLDDEDLD